MDSKVVNKLIRSEIWPILRQQGFTHFESRNAYAFHGSFINVVNFQSFNSYMAGGLDCTTFSFGVNLGVYIVGQPGSRRIRRDKTGRLLPHEYQCGFRSQVRKRAAVDVFGRSDIFFIDPDGRTVGACFDELRSLANTAIPAWFEERNDLDTIVKVMDANTSSDQQRKLDACGTPGSYNWRSLKSTVLLLKHSELQTSDSAAMALDAISELIGTILNFSTIQSSRITDEDHAYAVRELWDHLGRFRPTAVCAPGTTGQNGGLESNDWEPEAFSERTEIVTTIPRETVSARKNLWPILKAAGFTEFTERLAHRISNEFVEVVEFLPMDPFERKQSHHPNLLFRIGLGVFWPILGQDGLVRKNGKGQARPIANECHVSNWLAPKTRGDHRAKMAFDSIDEATRAISIEGFGWLEIFGASDRALAQLRRPDWELFWCYPMMRGYGAAASSRRLAYCANLLRNLGRANESEDVLREAEAAIGNSYMEHLQPQYWVWIRSIVERFKEQS